MAAATVPRVCSLLLLGFLGLLAASASVGSVEVAFVINQHVQFGQIFKIVGNSSELGNWNISEGVTLTWSTGDIWTGNAEVSLGVYYEYKAVVVNDASGACNCWMPGNNRSFLVPSNYTGDVYFVTSVWDASCGSACSNTDACSIGNACPNAIYSII
eukprot:Gb_11713 [translate_table: standard]